MTFVLFVPERKILNYLRDGCYVTQVQHLAQKTHKIFGGNIPRGGKPVSTEAVGTLIEAGLLIQHPGYPTHMVAGPTS